MAHKPGEEVPRDGSVHCVLHPDVIAKVTKGGTFPAPTHFGDNEACEWEFA